MPYEPEYLRCQRCGAEFSKGDRPLKVGWYRLYIIAERPHAYAGVKRQWCEACANIILDAIETAIGESMPVQHPASVKIDQTEQERREYNEKLRVWGTKVYLDIKGEPGGHENPLPEGSQYKDGMMGDAVESGSVTDCQVIEDADGVSDGEQSLENSGDAGYDPPPTIRRK